MVWQAVIVRGTGVSVVCVADVCLLVRRAINVLPDYIADIRRITGITARSSETKSPVIARCGQCAVVSGHRRLLSGAPDRGHAGLQAQPLETGAATRRH